MASTGKSNVARLKDAGFTVKEPLPDEYQAVIDELSDEEVVVLISVKQRLDEAEGNTPPETESHTSFFFPF